jgi:hypothetical protein
MGILRCRSKSWPTPPLLPSNNMHWPGLHMHYIDYAELETNFEQYVERENNEEDVAITRDGKPLMKLVAFQPVLPRIGA